jgi:anti-sigma regulatory factor (Ser/Thr protein kinase)
VNVAAAFPADVATLRLTRRFVESVLDGLPVTDEQMDAAVLVTSELASNAMCHAGDDDVLVRLSRQDDDLRIEVHDHGGTIGTADGPPWSGLAIVEAHSWQWGVDDGPHGKTVWARVRLR